MCWLSTLKVWFHGIQTEGLISVLVLISLRLYQVAMETQASIQSKVNRCMRCSFNYDKMKTLSQLRGKNGSYDCRFKTKKTIVIKQRLCLN